MKRTRQNLIAFSIRARDFCVYKILQADDPPHRLALGLAIGTFATFSPLYGLQMVQNVVLAWLLGANKLVGIPIVWITNPVTVVPIFFPCYMLGCWLTGSPVIEGKLTATRWDWQENSANPESRWSDYLGSLWGQLSEIAVPLFVGCTLVGLSLAVVVYFVSNFLIRNYRNKATT